MVGRMFCAIRNHMKVLVVLKMESCWTTFPQFVDVQGMVLLENWSICRALSSSEGIPDSHCTTESW